MEPDFTGFSFDKEFHPPHTKNRSQGVKTMNRCDLIVVITLFLLAAIPAHAYADPSGGTLFQILMPALAGLWAIWMIFANRVRRNLSLFYRKLRGTEPEKPSA